MFEINLNHWGSFLLYFIPALINVGLLAYVFLFLPGTRVNRIFSLFIFLLSFAQFADGMLHLSVSPENASAWQHVGLAAWICIAPVGVLFVVLITQHQGWLRNSYVMGIVLIPAIVFEFMIIAHLDKFEITANNNLGWIANPSRDIATISIFLYVSIISLLMPVILWSSYLQNRKNRIYGNQFLLLALGVSAPYIGGIIFEVILPIRYSIQDIPVTGALMTAFTVCAFIAIQKYKLLDYSPRRQFDRILETMTEGVMILDKQGKIMYSNPALNKLLGTSQVELSGEAASHVLQGDVSNISNTSDPVERRLVSKSGDAIWVMVNASPCLDNKGIEIGSVITLTNIDSVRKSRLAIARNEQRLNRAQEIAHVGSWDLNFATGKLTWSEEACRIYGFPVTENVQPFETWVSLIHPADLSVVMLEIKKIHETGSDSEFEYRIVLRNGKIKHIHSIYRYELDENGKPAGLFSICKDITEMKQVHENLKTTSEELETYIYKSSHDMHAPLSSILGLVNVSRFEVFDPTAVRYLGMIEQQAKKLDGVRADFIKAMHIKDATKLNEEVHVNAMIGNILKDLRTAEGFSRMNINIDIAPGEKIVSNEFLMRTILQNLIENSIKYQDYSRAQAELRIGLEKSKDTTLITIEDNGIGIEPEVQEKIFDMYFKTSEVRNGSGLGLYLVKKAVEKLDGKLNLRSSPGQGTKVTLSFNAEMQ